MNNDFKLKHLLLAGVIGALIGAAITPPLMHWHFRHFWNREKMHDRMLKIFSSRLSLTDEQHGKISVILDETRTKLTQLREETRPKFEAVRNETREKIRPLLNSDQLKKFERLDAELEARRKKRFDH